MNRKNDELEKTRLKWEKSVILDLKNEILKESKFSHNPSNFLLK